MCASTSEFVRENARARGVIIILCIKLYSYIIKIVGVRCARNYNTKSKTKKPQYKALYVSLPFNCCRRRCLGTAECGASRHRPLDRKSYANRQRRYIGGGRTMLG